jgi:hypothetical protein
MVNMVMNVMMHHVPHAPPRSTAHGLLRDRFRAISCRLGVVGRLLGPAGCRLSLRRRRLSMLSSRISARGRLISLIGRVDRILLRGGVA